ncbi:MAG: hypothetical protein IKN87_02990 [Bacilli bacterium]|nr:hypothetical protein [Bacilli bacterium]
MKKLFGGINLTWPKLFGISIAIGIYTSIMAMIPALKYTSFHDLTATFEVWIFFGIFIIMNSKSAVDSALKCFIFFLISQPLVYLIQDVITHDNLFDRYYNYWFMWTVACVPMGFIGYYMKKDKWYGLVILTPMLLFLGIQFSLYLSETVFSFPFHILTTIFCVVTLIIYPLFIFNNKKIRITGTIISSIIIVAVVAIVIAKPPVYSTNILSSGEKYQFDNTYKVYLKDSKYGSLNIRYDEGIETWMIHAEFKHAGKTEVILESPNGEKIEFKITIKRDTYRIKEKK